MILFIKKSVCCDLVNSIKKSLVEKNTTNQPECLRRIVSVEEVPRGQGTGLTWGGKSAGNMRGV